MGNAVYYCNHAPYVTGIVTKTGRKYDYIKENNRELKLEKGSNITQITCNDNAYYRVFKDLDEYKDWRKAEKLYAFLHDYFQPHQRRKNLSHNTLTSICMILERYDPENVESIKEFLPNLGS